MKYQSWLQYEYSMVAKLGNRFEDREAKPFFPFVPSMLTNVFAIDGQQILSDYCNYGEHKKCLISYDCRCIIMFPGIGHVP